MILAASFFLVIGFLFGGWLGIFLVRRHQEAESFPEYTPEAEGTWDQDDAESLAHFFNSNAGHKLRLLLQNHAHTTALWATQRPQAELIKACGVAAGVSNTLTWIASMEQFTSASDEQEQSETDGDQATSLDLEPIA